MTIDDSLVGTAFQSTPSVGRATGKTLKKQLNLEISIHALRGEGDAMAWA